MRLRHRITIKHDTADAGETEPNYQTLLCGIPCNVVPVRGGERFHGAQVNAETTLVIETRFNSKITPLMIAVNEETKAEYQISRILPIHGRRRMVLIEATEVVA